MAVLLDKVLEKITTRYLPNFGSFTFDTDWWITCREEFHDMLYESKSKTKNFYYRLKKNQTVEHVLKSLSYFENKLKLPKDKQIKIKKVVVNSDYSECECLFFKIPHFWKDPVRYNLLTLLIRNAPEIYGGELGKTQNAVYLFLTGHIFYLNSEFTGWVRLFEDLGKKEVKLLLSKTPTKNKKLKCNFIVGDPYDYWYDYNWYDTKKY